MARPARSSWSTRRAHSRSASPLPRDRGNRLIGGLSTGGKRPEGATGYPPAVRGQRIRPGQQGAGLTVLAFALLALTTGCTSDTEQPSAELPPASSTAAQSTPDLPPLGPAEFPVPDEARRQDEAGAEAFF